MTLTDRIAALTPEQRALFEKLREKQSRAARAHQPPPVRRVSGSTGEGDWPLSLDQERFWFMEQLHPGDAGLNMAAAIRMRGPVSVPVVTAALNEIVRRHAAWRTTFPVLDGGPVQRVAASRRQHLAVVDLSALPEASREPAALRLLGEDSAAPFDLERGPLVRARLVRLAAEDHICLLTIHHLVADFLSLQIVWGELAVLCEAFAAGRRPALPEPPVQYSDFAVWQRGWLQGEVLESLESWWRERLEGFPLALELPTDHPRPVVPRMRGGQLIVSASRELTESLRALARQEGATLFMAVMACFAALLHRVSDQERLILGANNANRTRQEIAPVVGLLLTQVPFPIDLSGDPSFRELLARVRQSALGALAHQDLPFGKLVEAVHPERDTSRQPIIQALVQVLDAQASKAELAGVSFESLNAYDGNARYDLMFSLFDQPGGLTGPLEYDADLFDPPTARRLLELLYLHMETAAAGPDLWISRFPVLTPEALHQVLAEWNGTATPGAGWTVPRVDWASSGLVHRLVEAQAAATPDAVAVVADGVEVTYEALAARVHQLARHLRRLGVGLETRVGVCLERSADLPVALMAVLEAGGCYLPLDPSYPRERLAYMLEDSDAPVVITQESLREALPRHRAWVVSIDGDATAVELENPEPPEVGLDPAHLAYVLYTSGSTGRPKGVQVPHGALVNFLLSMRERPGLGAGDVLLAVTPVSFDIAGLELYLPLLAGGRLVLAAREESQDGARLQELIARSGATALQATPATWRLLIESGWRGDGRLKVLCGGEALPEALAGQLLDRAGEVWNLYGPTETTIWSTVQPVLRGERPSIGRPIANTQVYVLSRSGSPVPVGVPGELMIGGDGLARGYLGRPDLTAERFVPDPFRASGARLYRTGDLARFRPDGGLEFLGRIDFQVKVRGFRIELGEIEAVLGRHPAVAQAVVVARAEREGDARLVAYVVLAPGAEPGAQELRNHVRVSLPEYMVPSAFMVLEAFPLTPNGKVDREALPTPERAEPGTGYVAPSTPAEEALTALWADVLGVEKVGARDNFFELGGHSILATRLMFRIGERLGVELPLRALFQAPTVAELAAAVAAHRTEGMEDFSGALPRIEPNFAETALPFPLTDVQEAYWIGRSGALELGSVSTHLYFEIEVPELDLTRLNLALRRLIDRHGMLRAIVLSDGRQQILAEVPPYRVAVLDVRGLGAEQAERGLLEVRGRMSHQVLPASQWPLFEIAVSLLDDRVRMHVSLDLLIGDAWSFRILGRELAGFYMSPDLELPKLDLSFRDYVLAEAALRDSRAYQRALEYWRGRLATLPPAPALPLVKAPGEIASPRFVRRHGRLGRKAWESLKSRASQAGLTPSSVLLAAWTEVLAAWSENPDMTINLTLFNRLPLHSQVDDIVGDFTSLTLLAVERAPAPGATFEARARGIQARLWDDLDHRLVSGVRVLRELSRMRGGIGTMMPVVFTSTLNQAEQVDPEVEEEPRAWGDAWVYSISQTPQVWLDHQVFENLGALTYVWDAVEELFPAGMLDDMFAAYEKVVGRLADAEEVWREPVRGLLPASQLRLLAEYNDTAAPVPAGLLHEPFLAWAQRTPDADAVITSARHLTYGQLDRASLALAHRLRRLGVRPNQLVAIIMEKGWEQVVAAFAILRAGGAYLPIDAHLPAERLHYLLERGEVAVALTQPTFAGALDQPAGVAAIVVDDSDFEGPALEPLPAVQGPEDLAYVIFTSGSTGLPKGVMIDHRGALNTCVDVNLIFDVGPEDRVFALSQLSFDLSVYDIFGLLAAGGALVIPDAGTNRDPRHWAELASRERVTIWNSVPALMEMLVEYGAGRPGALGFPLRAVTMSGDWIPPRLPDRIRAAFPRIRIVSMGGATEASIWSIHYPIDEIGSDWVSIPYGRPMRNQTFFVLDRNLEPRPTGVQGDLYIGGIGLAQGYWRDEEKTRVQFLTHPRTGEPLYRTGDLGRMLPDGNIEFLGRSDFQVKIQGHRIELGEIESALAQHPAVAAAAVDAHGDLRGAKQLVGYVVLKKPGEGMAEALRHEDGRAWAELPTVDVLAEIREFLHGKLPEYMVPAHMMRLESLPLSSNGKVDRKALPEPETLRQSEAPADGSYVAPETDLERAIAAAVAQVLRIPRVGAHDNFFDLGANSVHVVRVHNALHDSLGRDISLLDMFNHPSVHRLARRLGDGGAAAGLDPSQAPAVAALAAEMAPPIRPVPRDGDLPLSFAQERLWFLDQLQPGSAAYNVPVAVRLEGQLDAGALQAALQEIVRRHEALRTSFAVRSGRPVQVIASEDRLFLPIVDLTGLEPEGREAGLRTLAAAEALRPFDLRRSPLLRALLVRLAGEDHALLLTLHHIASDAWSTGVLVGETVALYQAFSQGRPSPLPELPVQYADFAIWQREWLRGEVLEEQLSWWRDLLAGAPVLQLATDRPRSALQTFQGADHTFVLPAGAWEGARNLAHAQGATPFMVLLAGFEALLHRYTGQDDLIVGTTIANRTRRELEDLIGFFINTLALRADLSGDPGFAGLVARARERALGAYAHQDVPFEKLVAELQPDRDLSRSPLFQVLLQLQNAPMEPVELPDGLALRPVDDGGGQTAKFDLVLNLFETGMGFAGVLRYNTGLFEPATAARIARHFGTLVAGAVAEPGRTLSSLPLLSDEEVRQLVLDWNDEPAEDLGVGVLHERFAAQAALQPQAVAVVCDGESLTYGYLDRRANQVANHLIGLGVAPGDLVGLRLERSLEMVAAILGVLKAGAAYVPLDPAYPAERIAFMVEDSGVQVVLSSLEDIEGDASDPRVLVSAEYPAYVIYTSGSTGRPKGVVVRHGNVTRLFSATDRWFGFGPEDVWTLFHSYAFDFSVWEIWGALLYGGRLVVVPWEVTRSPEAFLELLRAERVTVLNQTPSAFRQILWAEAGKPTELALRYVIFGGEALELASLAPWFARHGDERPRLVNMYGITETTVHVTCRLIGRQDAGGSVIGRAIPDLGLYVLDASFQPQPVGVPGEIHVGGAGLAQGYLGRPELTAERFVPNPFGEPGSRLYRSGDLARFLAGGDVEYLGRIDHQVKIRGFRIELGEIESALAAFPGVREAVVLAREDGAGTGERRLVAYVVPDGAAPTLSGLREALAGSLPDYMLPSALAVLEKMPLTANGKVDRRALPASEASRPGLESAWVAPATDLERFLAGLWENVLEVRQVGVHDDFFALGGSSITGAVLINRLQRELGEIVQVVVIFDAPTVAAMAAYLIEQHPAAVARLFGREALGGRGSGLDDAVAPVEEADLAALRSLIRPLPALSGTVRRNPPAVFVLSPPRSGSTLLRVMLGGHPRLFSPPELELLSFDTLRERKAAFTGRDAFWLEGVIRAVMEIRGCGAEEAEEWVEEHGDLTTLELYRLLQERLGGRVLVDKTPSYALDPSILRRAEEGFEEPLYIHLIRHPMGMIRSFEEAKLDQIFFRHEHPFTRRQLAEMIWLASHENIVEHLRGVPAGRQHRVRFEDLLREPEATLRGICAFLGVDYHPDMAEPYREKTARMTDGIHAESRMLGDVKFHEHQNVDRRVAESWRQRYSRDFLGDVTWQLAARLGIDTESERVGVRWPLAKVPRDRDLPLSFAQERLWFIDQLTPGQVAYNIFFPLAARGDLSVPVLEAALGEVARRHESLRTTFQAPAGRPVQVVAPFAGWSLPVADLSALPEAARSAEARRLADEEAARPFDLQEGPVLRATLVRSEDDEHALLLNLHHIAADGWSTGVLVNEVAALYRAAREGTPSPLPELAVQYADFAVWQREWLTGEVLERQLAYWRERLAGAATLALPADRPRPAHGTRGIVEPFAVPPRTARGLAALARSEDATLFMLLLAAFQALLGRHAAQEDVVVGSPIANRNREEIEPLIGFFVNSLVLRGDLGGDPPFREQLARVRRTALEAYSHQDLPFERLVEELKPDRQPGQNPLFQVVFALQNAPLGRLELPGFSFSPVEHGFTTTRFDLELMLREDEEGISGAFTGNADLFDPSTLRRLGSHLGTLLGGLLEDPDRRLSELPWLGEAERHQALREWSDTAAPLPPVSLAALFAERAARRPEAVAVSSVEGELTYAELERRSGRLARRLAALGVGPEVVVALAAERSLAAIVGLLGIVRAGGAYLPLDSEFPKERLAWMMADAGARVLLGPAGLLAEVPEGVQVLPLEADPAEIDGPDPAPPPADALLYILYTSGSTGRPKGVAVTHRNVVRLVRESRFADLGPEQVYLQLAPLSFDASTLEVWAPLANGGRLVLFQRERVSLEDLGETLAEHGITTLWLTAGLFHPMVDHQLQALRPVRQLLAGGDVLSPAHVRRALEELPGTTLINGYGPTEMTTFTCCHPMTSAAEVGATVPLGRPIGNTRVHILDEGLRPVPVGVRGELCAGGDGLSRGYFGRPELTAERFVPDPFSGEPGARLYRTGDVARFLADGRIEFGGRRDGQVKLRGFRVELGEVEGALLRHPGVREAAVTVREDGGDHRLVAYLVPRPVEDGDLAARVRSWLAGELPGFMVPSAFVVLDALPLTPNGKVDRRALPAPDREAALTAYVPPSTPLEELVVGVCAELLGLERVGLRDNFFTLGGHSLLATRLVNRLSQEHGLPATLPMVFYTADLGELSDRILEEVLGEVDEAELTELLAEMGGAP